MRSSLCLLMLGCVLSNQPRACVYPARSFGSNGLLLGESGEFRMSYNIRLSLRGGLSKQVEDILEISDSGSTVLLEDDVDTTREASSNNPNDSGREMEEGTEGDFAQVNESAGTTMRFCSTGHSTPLA